MNTEFYWVAVALTTVIAAARYTRFATVDKFPPMLWLREKYADAVDGTGWFLLLYCGYCFSFWATSATVLWGLFAGVYQTPTVLTSTDKSFVAWWVVNGIFAASYLAAIVMANDGDDSEDNGETA